jgi:hypothetical protein
MSDTPKKSTKRPELSFETTRREWVLPWRQRLTNGTTLDYQALTYVPTDTDLGLFEDLSWRKRQIVLARLRRLESEVNLKPLPAVVPLVAVAVAIAGLTLASTEGTSFYEVMQSGITVFVLIAAFVLLIGVRRHTRKEACLNAWTEAFKDSHAFKTKMEEEKRKADEGNSAAPQPNAGPSVTRYAWAQRIFG